MLTDEDVAKLNSAELGDIVELSIGYSARKDKYPEGTCTQCCIDTEGCAFVDCQGSTFTRVLSLRERADKAMAEIHGVLKEAHESYNLDDYEFAVLSKRWRDLSYVLHVSIKETTGKEN